MGALRLVPVISLQYVRSQSASFAVYVCVMYSASVDDNAIIDCFFELQVMAPDLTQNMYPEME